MLIRSAVALVVTGVLATVAEAQLRAGNLTFPYCQCIMSPGAFSMEPGVTSPIRGTYCFKVRVNNIPGCDSYCCTMADLKKIELDVRPSCRVPGISATATINGARSRVAPVLDRGVQGPNGTTILKLTQIGLNRTTANNTEICITLKPNNAGQGCTTLEQLCLPPAGASNGTCSSALFDSTDDCCPGNSVNVKPCKTCIYYTVTPSGLIARPYTFSTAQCSSIAANISAELQATTRSQGAIIYANFTLSSCTPSQVKICGEFLSDAVGAKLKTYIDDMAIKWLSDLAGNLTTSCPIAMFNHTITVTIGGDGSDPGALPPSCLEAVKSQTCTPSSFPFPKCVCNTTQGATPYAPTNNITQLPGQRTSNILYCFTFKSITPVPGPCANATLFKKVEFWSNEAIRTKVRGFSLLAANAASWQNISATWGGKGEETLKATPVNWTSEQANGGLVCAEVDRSVTLDQLCLGPTPNTCWVNIFDPTRQCCPLYPSIYSF